MQSHFFKTKSRTASHGRKIIYNQTLQTVKENSYLHNKSQITCQCHRKFLKLEIRSTFNFSYIFIYFNGKISVYNKNSNKTIEITFIKTVLLLLEISLFPSPT